MTEQVNECVWRATTGGDGDLPVASAITGYFTPAGCTNPPIQDGGLYHYRAESDDKTQHESGVAPYDVASASLLRSDPNAIIYQSSNGGAIVTFSLPPIVRFAAAAQDITTLPTLPINAEGQYLEASGGYLRWRTDPGLIHTYIEGEITTVGDEVHDYYVNSDGSGSANSVSVQDGYTSGHEVAIWFGAQADPADTLEIDTSNIINDDNSVPAGIVLTSEGQSILLEWRQMRNGDSGAWLVIDASAGAVT